jgi:hypothetical protein
VRTGAALLAAALYAGAQPQPPPSDPSDLINTLLGSLLGFREMSGPELQGEVAEVGGVAFRAHVPVDFMTRAEMVRYLEEVLDSEYPPARAAADERTLVAFDLLPRGADLRRLRAKLLQENIAGFYDERPGRKRLYAVSGDRRFTPANQLVLAHELRHALQDQYMSIHSLLPDSVGDFDDRRIALLSLLEGDATLVMERFLVRRLPGVEQDALDTSGMTLPTPDMPGAPAVLRDQLVLPYLAGRDFVRSLWRGGGWDAVRSAWSRPPESTEQVLHPAKYLEREAPRPVEIAYAPGAARLLNEGILGEVLATTLLESEGGAAATAGWGGDRFRVWDVSGRTLLVWRSVWDSAEDAREFHQALLARFRRVHGEGTTRPGYAVFGAQGWRFAVGEEGGAVSLVSSDDAAALEAALQAGTRRGD